MSCEQRGDELKRRLLAPGGPALLRLAVVAGGLGTSVACTCDFTETRTLEQATYDRLHAEYGSDIIPGDACPSECGGSWESPPPGTTPPTHDTGGAPGATPPGYTTATNTSSIRVLECRLALIDWQTPGVVCELTDTDCAIGRPPPGLIALPGGAEGDGPWLARMAHLEAASVHAFEQLAQELRAHGAPGELVARAEQAADDERRHAAGVADAARARGAEPPAVRLRPTCLRSLEELAIDNRVLGCIGEALGAMEAAYASRHSPHVDLRELMATIAIEEAEHAVLSYDIDDWVRSVLDAATLARVEAQSRVRRRHVAVHDPGPESLGMPPRSQVRAWFDALT